MREVNGSQAELTSPTRGGVAVASQGRSQGWQGWPYCFSTSVLFSSITPPSPPFNDQLNCCAVMNLPEALMSNRGMLRKILRNELFCRK